MQRSDDPPPVKKYVVDKNLKNLDPLSLHNPVNKNTYQSKTALAWPRKVSSVSDSAEGGGKSRLDHLTVEAQTARNEDRLANKCVYECGHCDKVCLRYQALIAHVKEAHRKRVLETVIRRRYTTFLQCQLCMKFVYCDTQILLLHLNEKHHRIPLDIYCQRYSSFLTGKEIKNLASQCKHVDMLSVPSGLNYPDCSPADDVGDKELDEAAHHERLTNTCKYECATCKDSFATYVHLSQHVTETYGRPMSQNEFHRTHTTFIQCQVCRRFLFCDSEILLKHIDCEHQMTSLVEYCQMYQNCITGKRNQVLASQFRNADMFSALDVQNIVANFVEEEETYNDYRSTKSISKLKGSIKYTKPSTVAYQIEVCEDKFLNKCIYECGFCPTSFANYNTLSMHMKQVHNRRMSKAKFHRSYTTFLQCQMCHKFLLCDTKVLLTHLRKEHCLMLLTDYCETYSNFLVGTCNKDLSERIKYNDMFDALTVEGAASPITSSTIRTESLSCSQVSSKQSNRTAGSTNEKTLGTTDHQPQAQTQCKKRAVEKEQLQRQDLVNKCVYKCHLCPIKYTSMCSLRKHSKSLHNQHINCKWVKRSRTTFIQCQICGKFILCDVFLLGYHLRRVHPRVTRAEYYSKYKDSLTGKKDTQLAKLFKFGRGVFRAVEKVEEQIKQPPTPSHLRPLIRNDSANPSEEENDSDSDSQSDALETSAPEDTHSWKGKKHWRKLPLQNTITYECGLCQKILQGYMTRGRHAIRDHSRLMSRVPFKQVSKTFIECQLCCKFIYCDVRDLSSHIRLKHKEYTARMYCEAFPKFLVGKEDEVLAEYMENMPSNEGVSFDEAKNYVKGKGNGNGINVYADVSINKESGRAVTIKEEPDSDHDMVDMDMREGCKKTIDIKEELNSDDYMPDIFRVEGGGHGFPENIEGKIKEEICDDDKDCVDPLLL